MVGPDSIRLRPDFRVLTSSEHQRRDGGVDRRTILDDREFRHGGSSWRFLGSRRASKKFGYVDTSEWVDDQTGTWIRVHGMRIVCVQANLSRLLTGNDHNGTIVSSQSDIDAAMAKLWRRLDAISEGNHAGEFTTVEVGGVVEQALLTFEALLRSQNFPGLRKVPALRPGESITFGATAKGNIRIIFYDPEKKRRLPGGRYTRIEVRLIGDRLRREHGGLAVRQLDFAHLKKVFYDLIYQLDPHDIAKVKAIPGDVVAMIALLLRCENCVMDGEHLVATWARSKSHRHARRTIEAAKLVNVDAGVSTLRSLLPQELENSYVHLTYQKL